MGFRTRYKSPPMFLRVCYEMPGTDVGYAATRRSRSGHTHDAESHVLRAAIPYAPATPCPVLTSRMLLPDTRLANA
eukprot:1316865-Rhodomonas_salina.7